MTTLTGRRAGGILLVAALFGSSLALFATPAGAQVEDPCKVLERSELALVLGADVGAGRRGPGTRATSQCEYQVAATSDRPAGTVIVLVRTSRAEKRFEALEQRKSTEVVDGLPDAVYSPMRRAVDALAGDSLLGIQGNFLRAQPLPLEFSDVESALTDLARVGVQRL